MRRARGNPSRRLARQSGTLQRRGRLRARPRKSPPGGRGPSSEGADIHRRRPNAGRIRPDIFCFATLPNVRLSIVEGLCRGDASLHVELSREALALRPGQSGLLALDWNNGNRTILVDPMLTGLLVGQTLYTNQAEVYRALIEATAFGARVIIEQFRNHGVPIERVVCCGGIAEKNPLLMQIYADVTGCAMQVSGSA